MGQRSRLLIVRHGQSSANRDRLVLGQSLGVELTDLGLQQARAAADEIVQRVDGQVAIISSDARRAAQTAEIIGEQLGVPVELNAGLREQYLGEMEGHPVSELRPLPVPEGQHISEIAWGGGESVAEVYQRLAGCTAELFARDGLPESLVLVSHGDALCVLQALLAGRSHREVDWTDDALGLAEVRDLGQPKW